MNAVWRCIAVCSIVSTICRAAAPASSIGVKPHENPPGSRKVPRRRTTAQTIAMTMMPPRRSVPPTAHPPIPPAASAVLVASDPDEPTGHALAIAPEKEILSCRTIGFYPFPGKTPSRGLAGWIFRDTHQAVLVRSSACRDRYLIDFMTAGGQSHPVWWDEGAKWTVLLGGDIRGEIRVRSLSGKKRASSGEILTSPDPGSEDLKAVVVGSGDGSPKLRQILQSALSYDCGMNLYRNNCRMFCAQMEREVERLNSEGVEEEDAIVVGTEVGGAAADRAGGGRSLRRWRRSDFGADIRYACRMVGAGLLPAMYPLGILWLFWQVVHETY